MSVQKQPTMSTFEYRQHHNSCIGLQEAQLSQTGRVMLRVFKNFAVTQWYLKLHR